MCDCVWERVKCLGRVGVWLEYLNVNRATDSIGTDGDEYGSPDYDEAGVCLWCVCAGECGYACGVWW